MIQSDVGVFSTGSLSASGCNWASEPKRLSKSELADSGSSVTVGAVGTGELVSASTY